MAPLGTTPLAIFGLQQTVLARKDDAGDRALALVVKSEATVDVGAATPLGTTYGFIKRAAPDRSSHRRQLDTRSRGHARGGHGGGIVSNARVTAVANEIVVESSPTARASGLALEMLHSVQEAPPAPPTARRRAMVILMS